MRTRNAFALICALALVAVVAAGCGSSNKKAAYGTPMSKADFQKTVNARCKADKKKVKDPKSSSPADIAVAAQQTVDVAAAEYAFFNDQITPPKEYDATWRDLLSRLTGEIDTFRQMAAAGNAGDQEQTTALLKSASEASNADKPLLRKIGLNDCA